MNMRPAIPCEGDGLSARPPELLRNRRLRAELHKPGTLRLPCDNHDQPERWFIPELVTGAGKPMPVTGGNEVKYLIDGTAMFASVAEAMELATNTSPETSFIYIIGWFIGLDFPFIYDPDDPDGTKFEILNNTFGGGTTTAATPHSAKINPWKSTSLRGLLQAASDRGVEIRVLLFDYFFDKTRHDVIGAINGMKNAHAILDNRLLRFGGHHQKIIVIKAGDELYGFCGGIDINQDRLFPQSRSYRPTINASPDQGDPYHDVHCRIRGPGAGYLLQTFADRWYDHIRARRQNFSHDDQVPPELRAGRSPSIPNRLQKAADPFANRQLVQIGRTFGAFCSRPGFGSIQHPPPQGFDPKTSGGIKTIFRKETGENAGAEFVVYQDCYDFAPHGEQTIKQLLLRAISRARRFIYLEDQYFMDVDIAAAVAAVLPRLAHFTAMIPSDDDLETSYRGSLANYPNSEMRISKNHAIGLREQFLKVLRIVAPDRVYVYQHHPPGDPHTYVHSKTWIIDDEFALIGSANCCRRSMTHDSEICAAIADEAVGSSCGLSMAHRLRIALWAEHLGMDTNQGHAQLVDGVASAVHWRKESRPSAARVVDHQPGAFQAQLIPELGIIAGLAQIPHFWTKMAAVGIATAATAIDNFASVPELYDPNGACPHRKIDLRDGTCLSQCTTHTMHD